MSRPNHKDVKFVLSSADPYNSKTLIRSRGRFLGKGRPLYGFRLIAALLKRRND